MRRARLVLVAATIGLAGCETLPSSSVGSVLNAGGTLERLGETPATGTGLPAPAPGASEAPLTDIRSQADFYQAGSGRFLRPGADAPTAASTAAATDVGGEFKLNFENTNLLEVVKVVLGDLLGLNYVIDPGVAGSVTLQSTRPLARDALIPTLEMLLRMNGAALVLRDDTYHVVPRELAVPGLAYPQLGGGSRPLPEGYRVRIVPLRHVAAAEMQRILEPFASPGNLVRVDPERNLLVLAGTGQELEGLLETIDIFDVDWLAGRSVALFTPDFVDAETLAKDLEQVLGLEGQQGPLVGMVRLVPIERLDALLVISARPELLATVRDWVQRLDRDSGAVGQRLYVYHVQNGKAADLADVLTKVFEEQDGRRGTLPPPELAPGLEPTRLQSTPREAEPANTRADRAAQPEPQRAVLERQAAASPARQSSGADQGVALSGSESIRVIADEVNNALLIKSNAQQYRQVQAALRELDIVPLQVLIEATIAEVQLTGELSQGLEFFFKNGLGNKSGQGRLDVLTAGLAAVAPGFSYSIQDAAGAVRAVLNTLASESRANIVSSPSLMVLNNQEAQIRVGDQIPVVTQQQQATDQNANIINTIERLDTGVLLSVTPRVNAGGLVIMEVEQEVSDVDDSGTGGTLTPTIQKRTINSTVAVQSGETVVLGGLIRENRSQSGSGIPGLHTLPVVGLLFGQKRDTARRTELVVLITPRASRGSSDARQITDEFRRKMESLQPFSDETRPSIWRGRLPFALPGAADSGSATR